MAKVSFASLKLKVKDEVKKVQIEDKEVEVKQYLPVEDKYDLVMISLQQAKENGIFNELKLDTFFHLNLVFMYSNLSFTDKQKEDLLNLYDVLESNEVINKIVAEIPRDETEYLYTILGKVREDLTTYDSSIAGIVNNLITQMPVNAQAAADIVNNFDPEKYTEVMNFARGIGMQV